MFEAVPESVAALGSAGLRSVLHQLHELARLPVAPAPAAGPAQRRAVATPATTAADREAMLLAFTTRHSEVLPDGDPGAEVLRLLTDEARLSLLAVHRPDELARLVEAHGREGTERLLREFLSESTASSWPRDQAAAFDRWLSRQDRSVTT
jgi:hypothetical protein